jgi:hypothetical protein
MSGSGSKQMLAAGQSQLFHNGSLRESPLSSGSFDRFGKPIINNIGL